MLRIVLQTDRDMEYVHMKDQRGSGTEPVNVLSRYKYQDGLYYYESTRDTASHFFVDYLPKGVYVFEYSVRLQHKGLSWSSRNGFSFFEILEERMNRCRGCGRGASIMWYRWKWRVV